MQGRRVVRWVVLVALALALALAGCRAGGPKQSARPPGAEPVTAPTPAPPPRPAPVRARIVAVGDLLMHLPLVTSSAQPGGDYDFQPIFEPVRPWIDGADLAIANLETTLTGPKFPYAGYPSFNTPPVFARDVKAVGFDAVTHANNHSLDYGEYGLIATSEALEKYGVPHTGTARTAAEREQILVVDVTPGIKMAILAYSYGTNGIPLPQPWSVNLLDPERMKADVKRARALPGVDLVAVALHMGDEYARKPNADQESYISLLIQAGADIVLGNHPHVIQPIQLRRATDEFGRDLPRAVIYSLGNFVSNQVGLHREAGLMLLIDVQKDAGITTVERISFVPTWVHGYMAGGVKKYRIVPVEKALADYDAKADPLLTAADYQRLQAVWADTTVQAVGGPEVVLQRLAEPVSVKVKR